MKNNNLTEEELAAAEELLPCPFCGSPGDIEKSADNYYSAGCSDMDCDAFQMCEGYANECDAIAAWNARASLPRVSVEEVAKIALNACVDEHAFGSSCNLSERDAQRIAKALRAKFPQLFKE